MRQARINTAAAPAPDTPILASSLCISYANTKYGDTARCSYPRPLSLHHPSELYDDFHAQPPGITLYIFFWQGKGYSCRNTMRCDKAGYCVDDAVPLDIGTTEPYTLCFQIKRRRDERE